MPENKSLLKEPSRQAGRFLRVFDERVNELCAFYKQYGRYPEPAEGSLGNWLAIIRHDWKTTLEVDKSVHKVTALESLPEWTWEGFRQNNRLPMIKQLKEWYLSVDGIADPSTGIPEQSELSKWMHRNRKRYSDGKMSASRIAELEAIPHWSWESRNHQLDPKRSLVERELSWMIDSSIDGKARSAGVTGFSGTRHQCDIVIEEHKVIIEHDGRLWHANMESVDLEKTVDLENAGWTVIRVRESPLQHVAGISVFVSDGASMQDIFESVSAALNELGVPSIPIDIEALGRIPGGRLPFYDEWYTSLEVFLQYIEEGGTSTPIATQETGEFKVGQWVYVQRRKLKRGQLSESKKNILESIPGWQWQLKPQVRLGWEESYRRLLEYQSENGKMPIAKFRYPDGFKLGSWVHYQRYSRRLGELPNERIELLEQVPGWRWGHLSATP